MKQIVEKVICDRCGNEYSKGSWLDGPKLRTTLKIFKYKKIDVADGVCWKHFDLCPDCVSKLLNWLQNEGNKNERRN